MYHDGWFFFGMHTFWWLFWLAVVVFLVLLGQAGAGSRRRRETPLESLQRRYAAGDISTEEYEERRKPLERDQSTTKGRREE